MSAVLPSPDRADVMTDARYPERWLNDTRVLLLSDAAHRLFVTGLAWSVSNRSDGNLSADDLMLMRQVDTRAADDLVRAGLWRQRPDRGYVIIEFDTTQTSAVELERAEKARKADRTRKARSRSAKPADETCPPDASTVTAQAGEDRKERQARRGRTTGTTTDDEFVDFPDPRYPADNYET